MDYLLEFLEERAMAESKAQIMVDRVYKDMEIGILIVSAGVLQGAAWGPTIFSC